MSDQESGAQSPQDPPERENMEDVSPGEPGTVGDSTAEEQPAEGSAAAPDAEPAGDTAASEE